MCKRILWIDCIAGATAGLVVLLARDWLSGFYDLPREMLLIIGAANVLYAMYSFSLAARKRRHPFQIIFLIGANVGWVVLCLRWTAVFSRIASPWGLAQLIVEAVFVGWLASQEWRCREELASG